MPAWVAWYTEGRRFSGSTVEQWKALPAEGLVWLTVWTDEEHRAFFKGDWYMWDGETFRRVRRPRPARRGAKSRTAVSPALSGVGS